MYDNNLISKAELERLYLEDELSISRIARHLHCSVGSVFNYLQKYGIPTRQQQRWLPEEDGLIEKLYQEIGPKGLSAKINRTWTAIAARARVLGIANTNKDYHRWTPKQTAFLKEHFPTKGSQWCANKLQLTVETVSCKVWKLKLRRTNYEWTEQENAILYKYYPKQGPTGCMAYLDRSRNAIQYQAGKLGLQSPLHYKEREVDLLQKHYADKGPVWCAKRLGRTPRSVTVKANTLRLVVSAETISRQSSGENHYNWRGGISKEPYPWEFNDDLKEQIRSRDEYRCKLCGREKALTVHHIDYDKQNCQPDNLITLCCICNSRVNFDRNFWQCKLSMLLLKG